MKKNNENKNSLISITNYRKSLYKYFTTHDFEWFCSLELPNSKNMEHKYSLVEDAEKYLKSWRFYMCTQDHIQIAYKGIIITSQFTGPHIHLLMFGKNKHGKTLLDMDEIRWQKEWSAITKGQSAVIEPIGDDGAAQYMSSPKNTPIGYFQLVMPHNKSLLEKHIKH